MNIALFKRKNVSDKENINVNDVSLTKNKQNNAEIKEEQCHRPRFQDDQNITVLYCSSVDVEDEKIGNRKYARSLPSFLSSKAKFSFYLKELHNRPGKKILKRSYSCPQKFLALTSSHYKDGNFIPLREKQVVPWKRRCPDPQHDVLPQENLNLVEYSHSQNDASIVPRTSLKKYFYSKGMVIFSLLVLFASILVHYSYQRCEPLTQFDLKKLERTLQSEFYGQNLSRQIIVETFGKIFSISPSNNLLIFLFVGRPGTGKTFVASLLSRHFPSSAVHSFVASAHLSSWTYSQRLESWITSHISSCSPTLLIFDDLDENHSYLFQEMDDIFENWDTFLPNKFTHPVILILISSSRAWHIDRIVVDKYADDLIVTENEMKQIIDSLKEDAYAWYKDLQKHKNFHMVPFLPLNKNDVKICIKDYLQKQDYKISDDIINQIADEMEYFPKDNPVFSKSGCKLVPTKVEMTIS